MISVREVGHRRTMKDFMNLPWQIYKPDSNWVPPLRVAVKELFDEKKNPFYQHASKVLFVAYDQDKKPVGRVGGFMDRAHNEYHKEKAAFFGFFESVNDSEVARRLIVEVESWARAQGAQVLRGPFNLNTNYEVGLLVDGFEDLPAVGMTYNPRYYEGLLTAAGFEKAKDVYAFYIYNREGEYAPERMLRHLERLKQKEGIRVRSLDMKRFDEEIERALEIYNDAWAPNWGFVPMTPEEFRHRAKEMKQIVDPELILIAEVKGEPAGFSLAIPDINRAQYHVKDGRLLPFGAAKLLWKLKGPNKRKTVDRFRILTLGVKKKFQSLGLGPLLYAEYYPRGKALKYQSAECSWVLEDNHLMTKALKLMRAKHEKTWRIYEKPLKT